MKIILIAGIVIECILLILLTALKKWTKKAFILIAALTAAGCVAAGALSARTQISQNEADQKNLFPQIRDEGMPLSLHVMLSPRVLSETDLRVIYRLVSYLYQSPVSLDD